MFVAYFVSFLCVLYRFTSMLFLCVIFRLFKAFDNCAHQQLWKSLVRHDIGHNSNMLAIFKSMYAQLKSCVKLENGQKDVKLEPNRDV